MTTRTRRRLARMHRRRHLVTPSIFSLLLARSKYLFRRLRLAHTVSRITTLEFVIGDLSRPAHPY